MPAAFLTRKDYDEMKQTKIDWCDCTVNPVVGCPRGCEYCYARKMNTRFGWVKDFSQPKFYPERLKQLESKNPKSVFINSMSDIAYWEQRWLREISNAINKTNHKYIMLTKNYELFTKRFNVFQACNYGKIFIGTTITTQKEADNLYQGASFINVEPILEPIILPLPYHTINGLDSYEQLQQLIIGAETGNRRGKVIPKKEWIDDIVKSADKHGIRVFMKESLRRIMGGDFRKDKLIWEVEKDENQILAEKAVSE